MKNGTTCGTCICKECGKAVEEGSMRNTDGKLCYHSSVCEDCYEQLESDE